MRGERRSRQSSVATGVFGLVLATVGLLLYLDRVSGFDLLWILTLLWPTAIVAAGIWKLVAPGSGASRTVGLAMLVFGSWWLADELGWVDLDLRLALPLGLVFWGSWLAWRALGTSRPVDRSSEGAVVDAVAILGGSKRRSAADGFSGGDLFAFMGGIEVDLRAASIRTSPAVIDVFVLWGGIEIKVPPSWEVELQGVPILAGFDLTGAPSPAVAPERLIVKGFALMGGVEVKR